LVALDAGALTLSVQSGGQLDVDVRGQVFRIGAEPLRVALEPFECPEPTVFPGGPPTASLPIIHAVG
jgi:alpha,alpha-trehalose phosphorylase